MGTQPAPLPSGQVTFLLTDIEGSTSLLRELGAGYDDVLAEHHRVIRAAVAECGGVEVKTEGDAFIVAFDDAAGAVRASVVAQQNLATHSWPDVQPRVRMGLHRGDARVVDGDYVSLGLHRAARVVTAAHGGQVLLSTAVAKAVGSHLPEFATLADLGAFHLRDFDEPEHLFELRHPDLGRGFPPPRAPSATVHNLAPARTSFVGMGSEVNELAKLSDISRVVTVVGAGGIGKTRLACEVGLAVAGRYASGVWLVELADLDDADELPYAVARALGVPEQPDRPLIDAVRDRLSAAPVLVLLDNCEHLLPGSAEFVLDLLELCPPLSVLATSREPLGVVGEAVFRVAPLAVPPYGADAEELIDCESVALFCERAARARREFALTDENAGAVVEICRRLDGIPLAIELAAARVGALAPAQIAARLGTAPNLGTVVRGRPERQRTVHATIDWSHRLLEDDEQFVFRRLAVFAGGALLEAVEAVCSDERVSPDGAVGALVSLVDKSLVMLDERGDAARYRLLEPTREYASDMLAAAGEADGVSLRHLEWCVAFAEDAEPDLGGPDPQPCVRRLEDEVANFSRALEWARTRQRPTGRRLTAALGPFWDAAGQFTEGRNWLGEYLAEHVDDSTSVVAARAAGRLAQLQTDLAAAHSWYERSRATATAIGDRPGEARAVVGLGDAAVLGSRIDDATRWYDNAIAIALQMNGGDDIIAEARIGLGMAANSRGDLSTSEREFRAALELAPVARAPRVAARAVHGLGLNAYDRGDFPASMSWYERELGIHRHIGDRHGVAVTLDAMAWIAVESSDLDVADTRLDDSLRINRELGDSRAVAHTLIGMAAVAYRRDDFERAAALCEESLALSSATGYERGMANALIVLADSDWQRGDPRATVARVEQALPLVETAGDRRDVVYTWLRISRARLVLDELAAAQAAADRARSLAEDAGFAAGVSGALLWLGHVDVAAGHPDAARRHFDEAIALARACGPSPLLSAAASAGGLATDHDRAAAHAYLAEALEASESACDGEDLAWLLDGIGALAVHTGDAGAGVTLCAAAEALVGPRLATADRERRRRTLGGAAAGLDANTFASATAAGSSLDTRGALSFAAEVLARTPRA